MLSKIFKNQPENHFMQNIAKNLKKDDLILARKQFPTFYTAQKTKWGHWSFDLTFCPPGALVTCSILLLFSSTHNHVFTNYQPWFFVCVHLHSNVHFNFFS